MIAIAGGIIIVLLILWGLWFGAAVFVSGQEAGSSAVSGCGCFIILIIAGAVISILF